MKNILIIGATSAIAQATARRFASSGENLFLMARNEEKLTRLYSDLEVRGAASVQSKQLDVNEIDAHESIMEEVFKTMGTVDIVLIAHGTLPDQTACQTDVRLALEEIKTNALSTISLLTCIANKLEIQQNATIAVITSVAGDRGRQSNYVYGAAKGMLSIFLQGLRNRLYKKGVNVVDIKPGFVDTPMTAEFDKGPLWAQPDTIAKDIVSAIQKGRGEIYTPFFWRYIMLIIRSVPEFIFKRLSL